MHHTITSSPSGEAHIAIVAHDFKVGYGKPLSNASFNRLRSGRDLKYHNI